MPRQHALTRVEQIEDAATERVAWDHQHQWRSERITEIDDTLDHHWADVALRAVHADDPLAFGVGKLRDAAATYRTDLQRIIRGLPDNANDALARARTDLHRTQQHQRDATQTVDDSRATLEHATRRHRYPRDKSAVTSARAALHAAEDALALANAAGARSQQHVADQLQAVNTWEGAFDASDGARTQLTQAVSDIYDALDSTRPDRVAAAVTDPTNELWTTLGPPPTTRGGLAAWCGIAERLEAWNDQHPLLPPGTHDASKTPSLNEQRSLVDSHRPDELTALLYNTSEVIDKASRIDPSPAASRNDRTSWQPILETAQRVLAAERPLPRVEHDLGLEL